MKFLVAELRIRIIKGEDNFWSLKERATSELVIFLLVAKTIVRKEICFVSWRGREERERERSNIDWKRKGYHPSQDILIRYFNTNLLKYRHTSDIAAIHCT